MPLIKKQNAREINAEGQVVASPAVTEEIRAGLSEEEIEEIRQRIINAANADGEKIKKDALKLAESLKEQAFQDGLKKGREEASRKMEGHIREALDVIDKARAEKVRIMEDTEADILKLSTKIANQLMNHELTIKPDIILNVVKDATTKISDTRDIILRVSQDDLEEVRSKKELLEEMMDTRNLTITADRKIERGGCMIETKLGFIDAKLDTKTDMMLESLLHVYESDKLKRKAGLTTESSASFDNVSEGSYPTANPDVAAKSERAVSSSHPLADDEFNPTNQLLKDMEADAGGPQINNINNDIEI